MNNEYLGVSIWSNQITDFQTYSKEKQSIVCYIINTTFIASIYKFVFMYCIVTVDSVFKNSKIAQFFF